MQRAAPTPARSRPGSTEGSYSLVLSTPFEIAASRSRHASAYLALVNQRLQLGCFDFDQTEERLYVRVGVKDVPLGPFTASRANRMVGLSVQAIDRYVPGALAVSRGLSPEAALLGMEGSLTTSGGTSKGSDRRRLIILAIILTFGAASQLRKLH
jgi:hypothetical protein